jgi:Abnormal spindle-like microcephaly-assoc'd, ASPM-SPD-2-Hydin/PQQ-like domain
MRTAAVLAAIMLAVLSIASGGLTTARADEVTVSQDNLRTGWDPSESALTPAAVGSSFGELFSTAVNGQVYAQPLVVGSTVIVTTENDWVYGLDATTGAVNWSVSLGTPWNIGSICTDLNPNIGVTGSPVFDPATGSVYLVAATVANSVPAYSLFGINAQTGAITEKVPVSGRPTNDSSITFNAAQQWERPGLLLMNGSVYAAFGSHCDGPPYDGFVLGVNVSTKASTLWSDETGVTDNKAGIWQSGGGLMSDGPGRIFFTSGNGVSPAPGPGSSPPGQLAESVVRLGVQSGGSLAARDFFSPKNAPQLDASDIDFGSAGPVGLPFGTSAYPHLLAAGGKYGRIYLLNRDSLGGREQGPSGSDAAVRIVCCFAGLWGHPAVFADTTSLTSSNAANAHDFLYYVGKSDYLRFMKFGVDSSGSPILHTVATSSSTFGYTSGSPVVTSNATNPSSAIVWAVSATGSNGANGTLSAFDAVPPSTCTSGSPCVMTPIWSAPIGTASKFSVPATDGARVYVGTRDGHVLGFGITTAAPLGAGTPARFGRGAVGVATSKDVTVTASRKVTVSGVSVTSGTSTDPFTVGKVTETVKGSTTKTPVTFPVTLSRGDALHAPVTFTPTAPGGAVGSLSFGTEARRLPSVDVPLSGDGTRTGLYATTSALPFALVLNSGTKITNVPVGGTVPMTTDIVNGGTSPERVTSVRAPTGVFSATGLPAPGTIIHPGQSVVVQVTFAPHRAVSYAGSFTVTGRGGRAVTVDLSGTGLRAVSKFTASPRTVNFGSVRLGHRVTATIHVTNAGNQPSTMSGAARLVRPFRARYPVARGLPVNGGDDLTIPVTFTPRHDGTFTGTYRLTWTDRFGTHTLRVRLTGTGVG